MVENERTTLSASAPTLLGDASSRVASAAPPARILASLEGRAPDPEVKHVAARKSGGGLLRWSIVLLLLVGVGVAVLYFSSAQAPSTQMAQSSPSRAMASAPAPVSSSVDPVTSRSPATGDAVGDLSALRPASGGLPGLEQDDDRPRDAFAALQPSVPATREASPAAVASIIDDYAAQKDDGRASTNPLAILSASSTPRAQAAPPKPNTPRSAAPTRQNAQAQATAGASGARGSASRSGPPPKDPGDRAVSELSGQTPLRGQTRDTDVKVLNNVMSYGLPPASPPGALVFKEDGVFKRVLPRATLPERLAQCRSLGFADAEQCRRQACEGHWGATPQCPAANAGIEP